jgi:phage-related minor tail protein
MANGGVGEAAEAGPEAIMPLRRMPSGRLGIETSGTQGGNTVNSNTVVIENINVKADENTDGNKVGRQVAEQVKAIVLQTLNNERRPGNSLNPVAGGSSF